MDNEILKVTSAVLVWLITIIWIPLSVWFAKRLIGQYDEKFKHVEQRFSDIEDELNVVDKKMNDVCKYQVEIEKIWTWIADHQKWGTAQNEKNHLTLQELAINIKRLCEKQGIEYLKQNGN